MQVNYENLYSEILPNLFISGTLDEDVVQRGKSTLSLAQPAPFDSVVCMHGHANPIGYCVREQRFGIADAELDDELKPEIRQIAQWLHSEWKLGKRVAAKCQAGWNRSGLIAALVLLQEGFTSDDVVSLIREKRSPNALCNPHFVAFIREVYEQEFAKEALSA
jgi:hypothetical protein